MNGFGAWLRNIGAKFTAAMRQFMMGRYGSDTLNKWLLICGVVLMLTVSLLQERFGSVRELLWDRTGLRYALTIGLFLVVLLMGNYGIGYDAGNFIYNQF